MLAPAGELTRLLRMLLEPPPSCTCVRLSGHMLAGGPPIGASTGTPGPPTWNNPEPAAATANMDPAAPARSLPINLRIPGGGGGGGGGWSRGRGAEDPFRKDEPPLCCCCCKMLGPPRPARSCPWSPCAQPAKSMLLGAPARPQQQQGLRDCSIPPSECAPAFKSELVLASSLAIQNKYLPQLQPS